MHLLAFRMTSSVSHKRCRVSTTSALWECRGSSKGKSPSKHGTMLSVGSTMYCIEIQPRIQAAHVVLSTVCSTISITCNSIDTTGNVNVSGETLCGWDSPKLILSSKPIINVVPQVGLCMRLRTERDFLAEQIVENALSDSDNEGKVSCHVVLRCGFCNNPLTKTNNEFKRALPLPSEAWYEFDAFCHGDDHKPSQLIPREGDLLSGESVLLVDGSSLSSSSCTRENNKLICKRCRSICGSLLKPNDGEGVMATDPLSCCKFELRRSKVSIVQSVSSLQMSTCRFARTLHSFSRSKEVFRFKVCDQTGRAYLSVWLMNTVSRVIHNCAEHFEKLLWKFIGEAGDVYTTLLPTDGYVLKVMFKSHLGKGCVGVAVVEEALRLDTEECLRLLLLLTLSNHILPPSQRIVHDYMIGLLSIL